MSMNSFSLRGSSSDRHKNLFEEEVSELLNLHPDGTEFEANCFAPLKNLEYDTVNLDLLKKPGWQDPESGRRNVPRYDLSLTVLIGTYFKAFRTKSTNISLSGLLLQDDIPDDFTRDKFDVVIIQDVSPTRKNYMMFRGRAIQTFNRTRRIILLESQSGASERLSYLFSFLKPSF